MIWSIRRAAVGVISLMICAPSASHAGNQAETCKQDEVVEFVARAIQMESMYAKLEPSTIGERPTTEGSTVLCSVYVLRAEYDYPKFRRMTWFQIRQYRVREINGGYRGQQINSGYAVTLEK